MISVKGCLSEELLKCNEVRGEYISMVTWDSMASIEAYRESQRHKEIREATRGAHERAGRGQDLRDRPVGSR